MTTRSLTIISVALIVALAAAGAQGSGGGKRPVVVEDMIRMTTIDGDDPWGDGVVRPAVLSHDGKEIAFVIQRGDLEHDTNISSIIVVHAKDVFATPRPDTLVTFTSSSSRPAITSIRWLPSDTGLVFIGERPGEMAQVWSVNIMSRTPHRLTDSKLSVTLFDLAPAGGRILYTALQAPDSAKNEDRAAHGFLVTQEVRDLLRGAWDVAPDADEATEMVALSMSGGRALPIAAKGIGDCYANVHFSSTGRFAINRCIRRDDIADWRAYVPTGTPLWSMGSVDVLIDLDRGQADRLLDLPAVGKPAEWSPDGSSILLTNSLLPLTGVDAAEAATRREVRATVIVDAASRAMSILVRRDSLELARWSPDGQTVVLQSTGKTKTEVAFRKQGSSWAAVSATAVPKALKPAPSNVGLDVTVEEDLNTPPRIVAAQAGKHAVIFDPNPGFSELAFAREEVFKWKTKDGEWVGGLYYPVGYTKGNRYPLVIQTHGFSLDRFQIAGYGITGYAGQALASHGIMVLQIGDGPKKEERSAIASQEENPFNVRGFEAAIDTLDKLGLIIRNKVALEGWSRTTFHVRSMLVNSSYPIAAALISDGYDGSYVRWVIDGQAHNELEAITGGPPIGERIKEFQERIPTMRPDRFKAPVRIESISYPGGGGPLTQWELYQFLRRLNKPVELIYYPRGEHSLRMPWERLTSQGGAFDWFRFWLTSEEDPSPTKAEQYKRWRAMRGMGQPTS